MEPIITVRDLGKCYTISHQGIKKRNDTLRDEMSGWVKNLTRKRTTEEKSSKEEFWALKDVSFDVNPGDRLGIIGRNGAGKSTLLKILSRITEPTTGEIKIKGRVASLLEVGTGFHPELTGRENIYLNGAILGMSRVEIKKKFDEIVAFSEVEKFLDTPVKRYSSGMYVRLAFAVAAHLEPEILIVDEVLAVGDAQFQKKCLGKMEDVSTKEGRTVLFVSHNMGAIKALCQRAIMLDNGVVIANDCVEKTVNLYLRGNNKGTINRKVTFENNPNKDINIREVALIVNGQIDKEIINRTDKIKIRIRYQVFHDINWCNFSIELQKDGTTLLSSWDIDENKEYCKKKTGEYIYEIDLPNFLQKGLYMLTVDCGIPNVGVIDSKKDCLQFEIDSVNVDESSHSASRGGFVAPAINWKKIEMKTA
jgi:lipopolysaccharide transport system ATP-binding protein